MEYLLELVWAEGDFEDILASALLITIFTCGHLSHLLRAKGRQWHGLYFCKPELVPNPHIGLPWQFLHQSQPDRAFIATMRINTTTFQVILDVGFEHLWNSTQSHRLIPTSTTNLVLGLVLSTLQVVWACTSTTFDLPWGKLDSNWSLHWSHQPSTTTLPLYIKFFLLPWEGILLPESLHWMMMNLIRWQILCR